MWLSFLVLMSASCAFALIKGGKSERAAALIILIGSIVSPIVAHGDTQRWHGMELGIFVVDMAMLIAFGAIMVRSTRFWPIWMTALQLLSVASHLGPVIRSHDIAIPFAFDEELWGYLVVIQLAAVTSMRSLKIG